MIGKLGKFEAIALILIIIINQIIINLPNSILISTGNSSWLNSIYIGILAVVFCVILCKLFKPFPNSDILDISNFLGGNCLKIIIGIVYIVFFGFIISTVLRYLANSLKLIYFNNSPLVFLLLLFLAPVIILNKLGLKSISQVNLIIVPLLFISILIILFSTITNFVPQSIYPLLGYGAKETFLIGSSNIFAFNGISYLYFLLPLLKETKDFKSISIISIVISAIYLFLSVLCLLMLFPFIIRTDEMLSVYLITRLIEFSRFFQRTDAIFIFLWIISSFSYFSVTSFYILNIFKKITKIKNSKIMIYSISSLILGASLIVKDISNIKFLERVIYKYFSLILVFGISFLILILANLKLYFRKRKTNVN